MTTVEIDGRAAGIHANMAHTVVGHPKCGKLHGHDVSLSVRISATKLDPLGFVVDFSWVKDAMRAFLKTLDHAGFVVPESALESVDDNGYITVRQGKDFFVLPADQVHGVPVTATTAEEMAKFALRWVVAAIPTADRDRIEELEVTYWETDSTGATEQWKE